MPPLVKLVRYQEVYGTYEEGKVRFRLLKNAICFVSSSFVIATYVQVRLIPQDFGSLAPGHFEQPVKMILQETAGFDRRRRDATEDQGVDREARLDAMIGSQADIEVLADEVWSHLHGKFQTPEQIVGQRSKRMSTGSV